MNSVALGPPLQLDGIIPFGLRLSSTLAIWTAVSSFIALSILLLFPDWTEPAVRTARVSTLMSAAIGLFAILGVVIVGGILAVALSFLLFVGWIIWVVALVPLVVFGVGSYAVSVITFGAVLSRKLGHDSIWLGVFVGALALTLLSFVPVLGAIVSFVVQTVGFGASLRVTFGSGPSDRHDRTIPSAHDL